VPGRLRASTMRRVKTPGADRRALAAYALVCIGVFALAVGLFARLYRLGYPSRLVWDEIYFPVFARDYLNGTPFFDLHPPLGKFVIAVGIALVGDSPVGWRIMPALFGCAMILLVAALGWYLFREWVAAVLLATTIACETMLIVYSRTSLMDGILAFFLLATFLSAVMARHRWQVLLTMILLGLAVAVKWAALPVAVPAGYILWRKGLLKPLLWTLWVPAVVYLCVVFVGQAANPSGAGRDFNDNGTLTNVVNWHRQALVNVSRAVPNEQASPWWSWPLMTRPVLLFYQDQGAGRVAIVFAVGNPLVWWASTGAVLAGVGELLWCRLARGTPIADHPLVPIVLGFVCLMLPWLPGTRIPYLYNYLPSYLFALLALVYWLCRLWGGRRWGSWVVVGFAAGVVSLALYFLPLAMGLPIGYENLQQHIWLKPWVHDLFR
jgi:dolichyl-phosphate-mannose-protein mannosyltransferase